MDNESKEQQNDECEEFKDLSREDLCKMVKRQRELMNIKFRESYGRINYCCIKGCIEMDIDTEFHASERVRSCESCEDSYCMNHGGEKKEVICSICGGDDDVFKCSGCMSVGPPICYDCDMKARLQRVRARGTNVP